MMKKTDLLITLLILISLAMNAYLGFEKLKSSFYNSGYQEGFTQGQKSTILQILAEVKQSGKIGVENGAEKVTLVPETAKK